MANVKLLQETEAHGKVKEIFEDIKKTFGISFAPNLFKAMAHNPVYLEDSWKRIKNIMIGGKLDRKTKEIIAVSVSATNNCEYCVNAHTAMLKQLGLTDDQLVEIMAVVDLFNGLNKFIDGLRIESDLKP